MGLTPKSLLRLLRQLSGRPSRKAMWGYDNENGIGVNPSDILLVQEGGAVFMTRVPWTREWAFLDI